MTQLPKELEQLKEKLATDYKNEDFKHNPDGYTVSPWCNSDHAACAFEAGFDACFEQMQARVSELEGLLRSIRDFWCIDAANGQSHQEGIAEICDEALLSKGGK